MYERLAGVLATEGSVEAVGGEAGASELAHTLLDTRNSAQELVARVDELLSEGGDVGTTLHEIGELLRHIDYHLRSSRYYGYVTGRRRPRSGD